MAPCKSGQQCCCTTQLHKAPTATSVTILYSKPLISGCQYEYEMWMMRESDKLNLSCIPEIRERGDVKG
jgi:hypothetical protein